MIAESESSALRVALTGGIASGKTAVSAMFAELGAAVVDTDVIAREVVEPGQPALDEIRERFGDTVFDTRGRLDRAALRRLVFADDAARDDLEAILHPRIRAETRRQALAVSGPYQLIVVPLLVGSPLLDFVDRVLVVDCSEQTQLERLLERDAEFEDQARRILAAQASREQRLAIADDIIRNDGSLEDLQGQVLRLDRRYRQLAARSNRGNGER